MSPASAAVHSGDEIVVDDMRAVVRWVWHDRVVLDIYVGSRRQGGVYVRLAPNNVLWPSVRVVPRTEDGSRPVLDSVVRAAIRARVAPQLEARAAEARAEVGAIVGRRVLDPERRDRHHPSLGCTGFATIIGPPSRPHRNHVRVRYDADRLHGYGVEADVSVYSLEDAGEAKDSAPTAALNAAGVP